MYLAHLAELIEAFQIPQNPPTNLSGRASKVEANFDGTKGRFSSPISLALVMGFPMTMEEKLANPYTIFDCIRHEGM